MNKRALITGITGQDGAYLAEFLLEKGYEVHGIKRRASSLNTQRIDHLYQDPHIDNAMLKLHYGDMTDASSLQRTIQKAQPHEIYNLAAQSHVAVSFEEPEYTAESDAVGTLRILEVIRNLGMEKDCNECGNAFILKKKYQDRLIFIEPDKYICMARAWISRNSRRRQLYCFC